MYEVASSKAKEMVIIVYGEKKLLEIMIICTINIAICVIGEIAVPLLARRLYVRRRNRMQTNKYHWIALTISIESITISISLFSAATISTVLKLSDIVTNGIVIAAVIFFVAFLIAPLTVIFVRI